MIRVRSTRHKRGYILLLLNIRFVTVIGTYWFANHFSAKLFLYATHPFCFYFGFTIHILRKYALQNVCVICELCAVCQYSMLHYTAHARISHEITTSYIDIKTKISFRYWIELMVFIFVFINSIFDSGCFGLFWCIEKKDRQKFQLIAERKNPTLIHSMNLTTFSYHQPLYTPFGPFKNGKKTFSYWCCWYDRN